jgi:hypothetical protein
MKQHYDFPVLKHFFTKFRVVNIFKMNGLKKGGITAIELHTGNSLILLKKEE